LQPCVIDFLLQYIYVEGKGAPPLTETLGAIADKVGKVDETGSKYLKLQYSFIGKGKLVGNSVRA
jgi:hypothetical protein